VGADHPQPFSAMFASAFQFFIASLWEDPKGDVCSTFIGQNALSTAQLTALQH